MARIPYFNFYPTDFMHGVRGLSAQEVGVYTMVLCRIYEESGPVEYNLIRLATYCGMRVPTFTAVVEKLLLLGKLSLSEGMLSNPRAEAEIAKRSDGLKLNSKAGLRSAEKRQQKQRTASTDVELPLNHTDTDTDTDKEKEEAIASKKKPRGARLAADWFLPVAWGDWALSEGLTAEAIRIEASKFKDYWHSKSGPSAVKMDWLATWRNWIRRCKENMPKLQLITGGSNGSQSRNAKRLAAFGVAARGTPELDIGSGGHAAQPLLDRR